jgi:plasmid stability protein
MVKAPAPTSNANGLPKRINHRLRVKWAKHIKWVEASLAENATKLVAAEAKKAEDKYRMASVRVARLTKAPGEQRTLLKVLRQKLEDNRAVPVMA